MTQMNLSVKQKLTHKHREHGGVGGWGRGWWVNVGWGRGGLGVWD